MSKTLRKAMLSSVAMLLVGVLSLTGVTYAWFTAATSSQVTGIELEVQAADGGVLLSANKDDDDSWVSNLNFGLTEQDKVFPVSTVGVADEAWAFFLGEIDPANPGNLYTEATDANYLTKTLYMKNEGQTPVTVTLQGTHLAEVTANGDRAARIGMRYAGAYDAFKPADSKTVESSVITMTTDAAAPATVNNYAIFEPNAADHFNTAVSGVQQYIGVIDGTGMSGENKNYVENEAGDYFAAVSKTSDAEDITVTVPAGAIVAVEVYVWVEGQDVDCINAMGGATMSAVLKFEKKQAT